ncbi:uncharacterized protein [Apostichopus japonicus]|uniref:uncharacterized protein n=1 Tax=Stichopus japonicus TaxID=307972 RepID=UPI003AB2335A
MLVAGSLSPRTDSRLDPATKSTPRLCKLTFGLNSNEPYVDEADQEVFVISNSRSSLKQPYESSPKRRTSISLPEISSTLFNATDIESISSESPELIELPVVDKSLNSINAPERVDILQEFQDREEVKDQRKHGAPSIRSLDTFIADSDDNSQDMTIIDLVSYANNPPRNRSTRQKYRNVRSAVQSRDLSQHVLKEKSHSARRPRREKEEVYLKCRFHERPCSRIGSFWREEDSNDLSRECCDVLGPRSCRECFRISERLASKSSNEDTFPDIEATPSEFFTLDLAQRMFPDMSTVELLHHLKEGNIATEVLQKHQLESYAELRRIRIARENSRKIRERINMYKAPDDDNFFKNFNDLKLQMVLKKKVTAGAVTVLEPVRPLSSRAPPPEIEMIPVATDERENPANYFGPPIMTQEEIMRQKSQPRFYAGESSDYKLPQTMEMTNVLRESNKAMKDLNSTASLKFGVIEEEEEEEEEYQEDAKEFYDLTSADISAKNKLSSASISFYKQTTEAIGGAIENAPHMYSSCGTDYRGRFFEGDDILDTDDFFSAEAQNLDSSSEENSSSSDDDKDNVSHDQESSR